MPWGISYLTETTALGLNQSHSSGTGFFTMVCPVGSIAENQIVLIKYY